MRKCVYCKEEKSDSEFSEEHVLPQAIGGNLTPTNPFKTGEVCRRCNNLCGLFVDRPFIRSWFTHNHRAQEAMKYVELAGNLALPLVYFGQIESLTTEGRICEFWMGPTGDSIYHFHRPYPEESGTPVTIGKPPPIKGVEIDPGFAFLFVRSNNPEWWPTILYSFAMQFKGSTLYMGNGNTPAGGLFFDIPPELADLHAKLKAMGGKMHNASLKISTVAGDRFLAKFMLGMGHLFLGPDFSYGEPGNLLRKALWERSADERAKIPIFGQSFFNKTYDFAANLLSWPGGHLIGLLPAQGKAVLVSSFYGTQEAVIGVPADTAKLGQGIEDGFVYVVTPGLQTCVGPIKLVDFLAHRQKAKLHPQLVELEAKMVANEGKLPLTMI